MHRCPTNTCRHRLHRSQVGNDVYWSCGTCHGRAVSINTVAKRNHALAVEIINDVEETPLKRQKMCPFCGRGMGVTYLAEQCQLELDYCAPCQAIWFDPGETDKLPQHDLEEYIKTPKAKHIKIQVPDKGWQYLATFIGLPAESHARPMDGQPILTVVIAAITILISILAFNNPEFRQFAFLPIEPFRVGGATFLTSFFLHGGYFHLLSNMYFLWVFGDDSEDYLGKLKYLLLLILATVGGNVCVLIMKESPSIIHIGASGGIFGVLTFYLLNFPKSRITFFKFFLWFRVAPYLALIYMLGIQILGAYISSRQGGFSAVSYGSHIGGAAVGIIFWLLFGESRFNPEKGPNEHKSEKEDQFKSYK